MKTGFATTRPANVISATFQAPKQTPKEIVLTVTGLIRKWVDKQCGFTKDISGQSKLKPFPQYQIQTWREGKGWCTTSLDLEKLKWSQTPTGFKICLLMLPKCKAACCTAESCKILIFTAHVSISIIDNPGNTGGGEGALLLSHVVWIHAIEMHSLIRLSSSTGQYFLYQGFIWTGLWYISQTFPASEPKTFTFKGLAPSTVLFFWECVWDYCFSWCFPWFGFIWWYIWQLGWTFCPPLRSPLPAWLGESPSHCRGNRWGAHPHQDLWFCSSGWFWFTSCL